MTRAPALQVRVSHLVYDWGVLCEGIALAMTRPAPTMKITPEVRGGPLVIGGKVGAGRAPLYTEAGALINHPTGGAAALQG